MDCSFVISFQSSSNLLPHHFTASDQFAFTPYLSKNCTRFVPSAGFSSQSGSRVQSFSLDLIHSFPPSSFSTPRRIVTKASSVNKLTRCSNVRSNAHNNFSCTHRFSFPATALMSPGSHSRTSHSYGSGRKLFAGGPISRFKCVQERQRFTK